MIRRLTVGLLLLALCGCGGARQHSSAESVRATAVYGSTASEFRFEQRNDVVNFSFPSVPDTGIFISLDLPEGKAFSEENWTSDQDTLHLLASRGDLTQLGIVPTAGYGGQRVSASFRLVDASRLPSQPPTGSRNNIFDLAIVPESPGKVRLTWTEVNTGDYDFNGEVNIADLSPLGANLGKTVAGGSEQRLWWIDGNRNGLIELGDLTPLGSALGNEVGGYIIYRNGIRLGDQSAPYTYPASQGDSSRLPNLPRLHAYIADGSVTDTWRIESVDHDGLQGSDNNGGETGSVVSLQVEFSGPSLLSLNKSTSQAGTDSGSSLLRVIWPVEDISNFDLPGLGQRKYLAGGGAGFSGVPRGVPLCADIIYVPSADLATGMARSASAMHEGAYPQDYYVYTRVPFVLPPGATSLQLDAQIDLTENPVGGYFVELTATHNLDGAVTTRRSRLDFAASLLTVDSDGDGSYTDEPLLADSWRTNVSDALRRRGANLKDYATKTQSVLRGTVAALDESAGKLTLDSEGEEQVLGSGWTAAAGAVVDFSELTGFAQREPGTDSGDLEPFSALAVGDTVEIAATRLSDAEQPGPVRWADSVTRIAGPAPDDSVYAEPEVLLAYPGQAVRVAVRTTPTASAFKSLQSLQVSYPASCRYKPGSFNAGSTGGGAWEPDGIWGAGGVGATQLYVPPADLAESLEGGRRTLRVQIRPLDGSALLGASGDLFSFELIVGGDCDLAFEPGSALLPLTAYSDESQIHLWASRDNAGQPAIRMLGERPVLALLSPIPEQGNGTAGNPYQVTPPRDFQLALYSGGSNVAGSMGASFEVTPAGAGSVSSSGVLHINSGYKGLVEVGATYLGLPVTDESRLYFNSGDPPFAASVLLAPTYENGGNLASGSFTTLLSDNGDGTVDLRLVGSNLQGLRALYFDLDFDYEQYEYIGYSGVDSLEAIDARPLLRPFSSLLPHKPTSYASRARLNFGLAMPQPGLIAGLSNGAAGTALVTLHFSKVDTPVSYGLKAFTPPQGLANQTQLQADGNGVWWGYYNQGDTDQNGIVELLDFNLIAKYYNSDLPGFPKDSLHDVIDCNDDELIDAGDGLIVDANLDTRVEHYRLYGGDQGDYSNDTGTLVESLSWSSRQQNGGGRLFFRSKDLSAEPHSHYWVVPVTDGVPGQKSKRYPN